LVEATARPWAALHDEADKIDEGDSVVSVMVWGLATSAWTEVRSKKKAKNRRDVRHAKHVSSPPEEPYSMTMSSMIAPS
jgi:hypothetical protein